MARDDPGPEVRGVVFDLDGTLVDSRRDLARAVNAVREERDLPSLSLATVGSFIGEGAKVLLARALPELADEPRELEAALARFLDRYDAVCTRTTRLYPGMREVVETLAGRASLAVLTNKPEALSRKILDACGLGDCWAAVVGGDTLASRKPAPGGLRHLAARLGVEPARLCLVGDSRIDAETARAARCRLALVGWGYTPMEELGRLPADLHAAEPGSLARGLAALIAP